jgi:hypothetical protein
MKYALSIAWALAILSLALPWVLLLTTQPAAPYLSSIGVTAESYNALTTQATKLSFYALVTASALIAGLRVTRFRLLAGLAAAGIAAGVWFLNLTIMLSFFL